MTEVWRTSAPSGSFDGRYRDYHWVLRNEPWTEAGMRLLTLKVTFLVQNKEYEVYLSTLAPEVAL